MSAGYIPDWRLVLNGEDVSSRIRPRLQSLVLTEKRDQEADELNLTLSDHDGQLVIPPSGAELTLSLGWKPGFSPPGAPVGLVDKGVFKVDQAEHQGAPDTLTLRARSADFGSTLRIRRDAAWSGKTLGQILQEMAGRHGLTPRIDPGLAGLALPVVEQARESDAAFLRRLGAEHDAVATIKAGRLIFSPKGKGASATGLELPTFTLTRRSGDNHHWTRAERDDYGGVEASWHNRDAGEQHVVTSGGGATPRKRLRRVYASEASARRAVKAEDAKVQRAKAKFDFSFDLGRPDISPEQRGRVRGFKPEIDSETWLVIEAAHALGDAGLTTQIQCETVS